jgi:putative ABC transport system permease protein
MQQSLYSDIASIKGVSAVQPILQKTEGHNDTVYFLSRQFTQTVPEYTIEGVQLTSDLVDNYSVLPTNITAGRNLREGDSGVVLLSKELTDYFAIRQPGMQPIRAQPGVTIKVLGQNFKVIGIFEPSAVENTITLYMNLADAQSLTGNIGKITSMRVFTESSDVVTEVANTIKSKHNELLTNTAQQRLAQLQALKTSYNTALQNAEDDLNQTQSMAMKEIIVVVAATSLIVLFVMLYTVRERTKEIGTLKAIGFSNGAVMSQFMIEGTMLSLIAGVVGIAIAFFAASTLSSILLSSISSGSIIPTGEAIVLDPQLMLLALGTAVLLGVLGSLYPAWRASRTRPAEAMRYE